VAEIEFVDVTRVQRGMWRPVLDRVSFSVHDGELMVVTGVSASGKSSLLKVLAGGDQPDSGRISIDGRDVARVAPDKRGVSTLAQGFALFPQLSVRDNIAFPLAMRKNSAKAVAARVQAMAQRCGVADWLSARPDALNFDLRQRAMMARALVGEPRVICLDEPLAGSGVPMMMRSRTPIATLQREFGVTMLYATCSSTDALAIADRIAVLDRGAVQQIGTAVEVFERPATVAVAEFVGQVPMNVVPAVYQDGFARVGGLRVKVGSSQAEALTGEKILVGLRAEDLSLVGGDGQTVGEDSPGGILRAVAVLVKDSGREYLVHARMDGPDGPVDLVVRHKPGPPPARGESLSITVNPEVAHLFDPVTGLRLPD
jgi:multiple sugar transport system ATP-binding protein